ncbi:Zn-dependent hydrolase [Pseudoalteromonas rubra]|uniref:Zn-dependent hydrolase n=1 Tax=Pseudoalteromonas rubra TaxID=43658 RepID=A0A5S3WF59_9GAMM|nr:MBL fold metallo-hydrolase [Pseudoalteromonas rubra]TMP23102.1 Zn-dependent hydrolase [Pseudoalteromonas rubra]TMP33707.1 Zn-dependent hydrolase [Pseudoalteromonas rubra]
MKIHTLEGYIQNIYLVAYPDKLLLLDGCSRADVAMICQFITDDLNRPLHQLRLIVVTHMHPDHAGGAHYLRKLTGAQIATANCPGQWYRGLDGMLMHLSDIALALWVAGRKRKARKNLWYSRTLTPDVYLPDGAKLPGFEDWQALHTPGHTDRDISLYHAHRSTVYIADVMVQVRGKLIPPYPVFYPRLYRATLLKLQQLSPATVMLAHHSELAYADIDFAQLLQLAPKQPVTHWRSVKTKTKRALGLGKRRSG